MSDFPDICAWARLWSSVRPPYSRNLRAGGWYPVVRDQLVDRVTIKVGESEVDVPRRFLELRPRRPNLFSVVHRVGYDAVARRQSVHKLGKRYAVCPACRSRFALIGQPEVIQCPQCRHVAEVCWWEVT